MLVGWYRRALGLVLMIHTVSLEPVFVTMNTLVMVFICWHPALSRGLISLLPYFSIIHTALSKTRPLSKHFNVNIGNEVMLPVLLYLWRSQSHSKECPLESHSNSFSLFFNLTLCKYPHLKASPYSLVGQPASITVVISVGEGSLQLAWCCDGRRVLHAHPLGVSEGQAVAVMGGAVVKYNTLRKEIQNMKKLIRDSGPTTWGSQKYLWNTTPNH